MTTYANGITTNQKPLTKTEFINLALFKSNRALKMSDQLEQDKELQMEISTEFYN